MKTDRALIAYFVLAYFFSWIFFVLLAFNRHGFIFLFPDDPAHARTLDVWHAFGGLGPLLGAIVTILVFHNRERFRQFFDAYSFKKLTMTGWLLALSPILIFCIALLAGRIINGEWLSISGFFRKNDLLTPSHFIAWFFPLLTYGFGEEAGWRGYALPHLQSKYSALLSTTILAVLWVGWHIPTFFYRYPLSGGMFIGLVLGIFAGAICMTFLFNFTKGSILAVSLWHFTFNLVSMIGTDAVSSAVMSTIVMVLAVILVIIYGARDLSPFPKTKYPVGNTSQNIP